jgi:hypothetical protein
MPVEQEVCGRCRRPRDEREIESGRELLRERRERLRRRPWAIARWIAAALVLVAAFRSRGLFIDQARALRADVRREMKNIEGPAEAPAASSQPAPGPAAPPPTPFLAAVPPGKAPAPRIAGHAAEPDVSRSLSQTLVLMYGVVFDLTTLAPVPNALVTVTIGRDSYKAASDGDGHYQVNFNQMPDDPSAFVSVSADGYPEGQLEDPSASYLDWPLKSRLAAIEELNSNDMGPILLHAPARGAYQMDMALLPKDALPHR